jgi:hypothetical protein
MVTFSITVMWMQIKRYALRRRDESTERITGNRSGDDVVGDEWACGTGRGR